MARRRKHKSKFQKLTIFMAVLMAIITLAAIIAQVYQALASGGY